MPFCFPVVTRTHVSDDDSCNDDALVGGIIFLHDITEDRATVFADNHAWPVKYFDSPALLQHLFLTTGKWDMKFVQSNKKKYNDREKDLKQMPAWRRLLNRGATSCQYEGNYESAWKVIDKVLEMDALRAQLLRKEFNMIQGKMPGLQRPKPGFWRMFRNLFSRVSVSSWSSRASVTPSSSPPIKNKYRSESRIVIVAYALFIRAGVWVRVSFI